MSFSTRPQAAPSRAVIEPYQITTIRAVEECSNIGEILMRMYTPAVTIVLECYRLDTGVGPAIAALYHTFSPIWADLAEAARIKLREISYTRSRFI